MAVDSGLQSTYYDPRDAARAIKSLQAVSTLDVATLAARLGLKKSALSNRFNFSVEFRRLEVEEVARIYNQDADELKAGRVDVTRIPRDLCSFLLHQRSAA